MNVDFLEAKPVLLIVLGGDAVSSSSVLVSFDADSLCFVDFTSSKINSS